MYGQYYRQGVNSLSIVWRLSTLRSFHYQRFHCSYSPLIGVHEIPAVDPVSLLDYFPESHTLPMA